MITRRVLKPSIHVWTKDPAIDHQAPGLVETWRKYQDTGDPKLIPVLPGQQLTLFHILSLTRAAFLEVSDVANLDARTLMRAAAADETSVVALAALRTYDFIVRRGLVRIENWFDENGLPLQIEHEPDGRGGQIVKTSSIADIYNVGLINELGLRILEISMPSPS